MNHLRHAVVVAVLSVTVATVPASPGSAADSVGAPVMTIAGPGTGLTAPQGLARDRSGNLYVADLLSDSVRVFAPSSNGNAAPIATIGGPATGLSGPRGLGFDAAGNLYVSSYYNSRILTFAPGARGDIAPTRVLAGFNTGLVHPSGITLDAAGRVYVTDTNQNSLSVFAPGATGNIPPVRLIRGTNTRLDIPGAVARASDGRMYVTNEHNSSVTIYDANANGNVAPSRVLAGMHTGLLTPGGIAIDAAGRVHVGNYGSGAQGSLVSVFAADANGDVAPIRSISSPYTATQSTIGTGVLLDGANNVWVSVWQSTFTPAVFEVHKYAALVPPPATPTNSTPSTVTPSAVRSLKVSGVAGARYRKATWMAPLRRGMSPVRSYRVVVRKGTRVLLATSTTRRSLALPKRRLARGLNTVTVRARNTQGYGATAAKAFRVRK